MRNVQVFQIYYDRAQEPALDPAFTPYFRSENERPEWREYWVFRKEYFSNRRMDADCVGFFSWKFGAKTGVAGQALLDFVSRNPGYDAYFVNPFPQDAYLFPNVWVQGEHRHPHLIELTERLLAATGRRIDLRSLRMSPDHAAFCNFWVGTKDFWRRYMALCDPIFQYVETGLPDELRHRYWSRADQGIDSPYLPFIMERMFSTLLATEPVRALRMDLPPQVMKQRFGRRLEPLLRARDALRAHWVAGRAETLESFLRLAERERRVAARRQRTWEVLHSLRKRLVPGR